MFFDMTALYGVRKVQDLTKYQIHGGRPLHGTIEISGAKNAAVAIPRRFDGGRGVPH